MKFSEFKAWLDGFEHSFMQKGAPSETQWQLIREKLAEVKVSVRRVADQTPVYNPSILPSPVWNGPTITHTGG